MQELQGLWPKVGQPGSGLAGRFHNLSVHHRHELAKVASRSVLGNGTREDLVAQLAKATGRSIGQARQLFHDATIEFSRAVEKRKADRAGYEFFVYRGSMDQVTRPFCRRYVDRIMSREEIDELDNDQTGKGTAWIAGGGYNCRHHWRPVKKRWYDDAEWEDLRGERDPSREEKELLAPDIIPALDSLEGEIRWKPGKLEEHVAKRIEKGHLPPGATPKDYEAIIRHVARDPNARVGVFLFDSQPPGYPIASAMHEGSEWLVMTGPDGLKDEELFHHVDKSWKRVHRLARQDVVRDLLMKGFEEGADAIVDDFAKATVTLKFTAGTGGALTVSEGTIVRDSDPDDELHGAVRFAVDQELVVGAGQSDTVTATAVDPGEPANVGGGDAGGGGLNPLIVAPVQLVEGVDGLDAGLVPRRSPIALIRPLACGSPRAAARRGARSSRTWRRR